jgi:transcriptional regulator with XRE-family HTH domain
MDEPRRKTFLREWRKHRGFSLEAAAAEVGITKPTLSRIERGEIPYKQDLLENLGLLYGCHPAELLIQDPAEASNIVQIWERASHDQRRALGTVAETMIGYGATEPAAAAATPKRTRR